MTSPVQPAAGRPPSGDGEGRGGRPWVRAAEATLLSFVTFWYLTAAVLTVVAFPRSWWEQDFVVQASQWISGRLDLPRERGIVDVARFNGREYLISAPWPAVLLVPAVAFWGSAVRQEYLTFALTALNAWLLWRLGRQLGLRRPLDRWWLVVSLLAGSVYLGVSVVHVAAYLSQVAATTGLLLALVAVTAPFASGQGTYRRWLTCGLGSAIAVASRPSLAFVVIPFAVLAWRQGSAPARWKHLVSLCLPVAVVVGALGAYNWARFGVPWQFGYAFADWGYRGGVPPSLFSLRYLPANLYHLLLALPQFTGTAPYLRPNFWGTSIILTSPVLLSLLVRRPRGRLAATCGVAALLALTPSLLYFGIGFRQLGYRYALDALPFLYVLVTLAAGGGFPPAVKLLMLVGVLSNGWLLLSAFLG